MVFQDANSAFNPRLNIGQALDAPLRLITDWDEETRNQKIFETLSLVGLYPDYTNLKIKHSLLVKTADRFGSRAHSSA